MPYPCFLLAPVPQIKLQLRRYVSLKGSGSSWTCAGGYHDAFAPLAIVDHPLKADPAMSEDWTGIADSLRPAKQDPRWPRKCSLCSYEFQEQDEWQVFSDRLMARSDNKILTTIREAPVGAMWFAWWYKSDKSNLYGFDWDNQTGPDLIVKTPGGEWNIDSRARNCTLAKDRLHRCWVRHGLPPNIHVDKSGRTCSAGAGSIVCGKYHGFLRNGSLTDGC